MKLQNERLKEIGFWATPPEWSPDYKKVRDFLNARRTPEQDEEIKKRFNIAKATVAALENNGSGLQMSEMIRYYMGEFNNRAFTHGLHLMPTSFNFTEAFLRYVPEYNYFGILPEIDISFSFEHFLDWFTTPENNLSLESILSCTQEETIYSFNNFSKPDLTTFSLNKEDNFCFSGASLVRTGNEVVISLVIGLPKKEPIPELHGADYQVFPGKEKIKPSDELNHEIVTLEGAENFQKAIAVTRLDINTKTKPFRYLALDMGDSFISFTDDISVFTRSDGKHVGDIEKIIEANKKSLDEHQAVFELAKTLLMLPEYKLQNTENTRIKSYETKLKFKSQSLKGKKQYQNAASSSIKYTREVFEIKPAEIWLAPDNLSIYSPTFNNPLEGYWKMLKPWEIGVNKEGFSERGRTWIRVEKVKASDNFQEPLYSVKKKVNSKLLNEGFIYVMRNAQYDKNVFKVGLTTKTTNERASQLSSASGVIDHFHVMEEWQVNDCKLAEKIIHEHLDKYRVTNRREFFKCEYKEIFKVIHEVVENINSKA